METIKVWLSTTKFKNLKVGERFIISDDPNVYVKDTDYSGITNKDGWMVICAANQRVKRWLN